MAVFDIGLKGYLFLKKKFLKNDSTPSFFQPVLLSFLHQNKVLHNFCKSGSFRQSNATRSRICPVRIALLYWKNNYILMRHSTSYGDFNFLFCFFCIIGILDRPSGLPLYTPFRRSRCHLVNGANP